MNDLEYTGERLVPGKADPAVWYQHMARYMAVAGFVAGRRVLDAGCGAGYGSHFLASHGARSVVAVDLSPDAVAYARQNFSRQNLEFRVADVTAPYNETFDTVISFEVIEHLNQPDKFLASIASRLAPEGLFVVSTPDRTAYRAADDPNPFHTREYDLNEFRALLKPHFRSVRILSEHYLSGIALSEAHEDGDLHVKKNLLNIDAYNRYLIAFCSSSPSSSPALPEGIIPFGKIDWGHFEDMAARDIEIAVPPDHSLILIDQGSLRAGLLSGGRRSLPLIEKDGQDWGPPGDDVQAVSELERQRQNGAKFLVLVKPAFWWFDYYTGLANHLRSHYRRVLENDRVKIFNLETRI
jgi:SAM-dependent methyltransferase